MKLIMDRLASRILQQKDSSYKWQFCIKSCASPRLATWLATWLASLGRARVIYKVLKPDVSGFHQNIGV